MSRKSGAPVFRAPSAQRSWPLSHCRSQGHCTREPCGRPRTHHAVTRQNGPNRRTRSAPGQKATATCSPGDEQRIRETAATTARLGQCRGDPVHVPTSPLIAPAAACPRLSGLPDLPGRVRLRFPRGVRPVSNQHLLQLHTLQLKPAKRRQPFPIFRLVFWGGRRGMVDPK